MKPSLQTESPDPESGPTTMLPRRRLSRAARGGRAAAVRGRAGRARGLGAWRARARRAPRRAPPPPRAVGVVHGRFRLTLRFRVWLVAAAAAGRAARSGYRPSRRPPPRPRRGAGAGAGLRLSGGRRSSQSPSRSRRRRALRRGRARRLARRGRGGRDGAGLVVLLPESSSRAPAGGGAGELAPKSTTTRSPGRATSSSSELSVRKPIFFSRPTMEARDRAGACV